MGNETSYIAVIDYEMGNLFSVRKACEHFGAEAIITADVATIMKAAGVILPGVGSFGDAMENLRRLDIIGPIKDFIGSGRPFMGICLGLQLLMSESEEFGHHKGLDVISGSVVRFPNRGITGESIKVPQVGWNRIYLPSFADEDSWDGTILKGVRNGEYMYFVHSYYVTPGEKNIIFSTTVYEEIEYCSGLRKGNVYAFQFHPEKSGANGLNIYGNFISLVNDGGNV